MRGHAVFVVDKLIVRLDFLPVVYPHPSTYYFISALIPTVPVQCTTDLISQQNFIASFHIWSFTSVPLFVSTQDAEVNA
jgi:hypothetical protein